MKITSIVLALLIPVNVYAAGAGWVQVPFSMYEVYNLDLRSETINSVSVVGTSGLSLADDSKVVVTTFEVIFEREYLIGDQDKALYRCMEYFDADMLITGQACYELRQ